MRALSLHQPWASFVAAGFKTIETRSWGTTYRGPIAIHAAKTTKSLPHAEEHFDALLELRQAFGCDPRDFRWPHGAVVAYADLVDCLWVEGSAGNVIHGRSGAGQVPKEIRVDPREFVLGDLSVGRVAWVLRDVRKLVTPVPLRGQQGLWTLDGKSEALICKALTVDRPRIDEAFRLRIDEASEVACACCHVRDEHSRSGECQVDGCLCACFEIEEVDDADSA